MINTKLIALSIIGVWSGCTTAGYSFSANDIDQVVNDGCTLKIGSNIIKSEIKTYRINVKIVISKYDGGMSKLAFDPYFFWGTVETPPRSVVREIDVSIRGQNVALPMSSWAGVGDPQVADVQVNNDETVSLRLVGGDAAGGYMAAWKFKYLKYLGGFFLIQRRVILGESPETSEETNYTLSPPY